MMHMTFYWGKKVTILFDFWRTDSWLSYSLTLLACFIFASFYQYMEDRRIRFKSLSAAKPSGAGAPLIPRSNGVRAESAAKAASAVLFGVNSAIGYLLMLAVMSFNGGVFSAIVLGLSVGYLAFRSVEDTAIVENPCACA